MGNLYLITGDDEFGIKEKSKEIIKALCGENFSEHPALTIVDGSSDELKADGILAKLLVELESQSLFSPERIIWLRYFKYFKAILTAAPKKGSPLANLIQYIKDGIPDDITLIIDGPEIDRRKAFFKAFKNSGEIHYLEKLVLSDKGYLRQQTERIREYCQKNNKNVDQQALRYLSETLGSDMGVIHNEINKVIAYIGDAPTITLDVCQSVCTKTPEALAWDFSNALMSRSKEKALVVINTLMSQKKAGSSNNELGILSMGMRAFQNLIKVKAAIVELNVPVPCNSNYFSSIQHLKRDFPNNFLLGMHPFRAYNLVLDSQRFSDAELAHIINEFLETNIKLVSGDQNPQMRLEQFVLSIL